MKRKYLILVLAMWVVLFLTFLSKNSEAFERYAVVSTTFEITKHVNCDTVNMSFKVWAEGDNYQDTLKRLKPINNKFLTFLKKIYPPFSIKTVNGYDSTKMASIIIKISTKRIKTPSEVITFISNQHFPYKTGIKLLSLNYTVSNKKETEIKNQIFKEALVRCKKLLKIVKTTLNKNYKISYVDVKYSGFFFVPQTNIRLFSKQSNNNNFSTSSGQKLIKATVRFSAIAPIK